VAAKPGAGFRFVLAQPAFRLIWFAQLASQLADKFLMFSLIILAYRLSGGSTPVAFTLMAYTLPAVVIAPLAGVYADRHDRKLIMVFTNFARALLIVLIPLASMVPGLRNDFFHLLLITFLMSAVGQLFSPAEAAAIPSVLPKEALITANSMVLMTMVLTLVVGGTLAPISSRVDIYMPYWLATGLFCVSGLLLWAARIPKQEPRTDRGERHPFHQLAVELREGSAVVGRSPVLLLSFFKISLAVLVMFMLFTLAPAYVSRVVAIQAQDSYVILVPATLGALVSALFVGQLGNRIDKRLLLVGSVVATGLTLLVLAAGPRLLVDFKLYEHAIWFAAGLSFLLGVEFGALMIPPLTFLMENTDDAVRGRIFALLFMVINGATAVPVLVAAALSDMVGIDRVIGGLGVVLILAGVGVASAGRRIFEAGEGPPRRRRSARGRPDPGT
jgi:MFS family permease